MNCVVLHDKTVQDMSWLFDNEQFSDVKLVAGDRNLNAHRLVLAKSSSVFTTMLYGKHWLESVGKEVTMIETPECQAVFHRFIKYFYTSEVSISAETVVCFLCLADKYDVTSLKNLCLSYMLKRSHTVNICTVVSWYTWSKAMNFCTLASRCAQVIMLNLKLLIKSSTWVDLDIDNVSELLSSSEVVIEQEYDLFLALSRWLLEESRLTILKENSERLLRLIRFPQMQTIELLKVEESELKTHKECSGLLQDLVAHAYRFRALCQIGAGSLDFTGTFYMPRDYLTRKIDSITINSPKLQLIHHLKADIGPVVSGNKNGRWGLDYRYKDRALKLTAEDLLGEKVPMQISLLVTDIDQKVIQSLRTPTYMCEEKTTIDINLTLSHPDMSYRILILLKPLPSD